MTAIEKPPQLDPALVKAFVIAGHGRLAQLKDLLAQEPALINASWNWGGDDWETALGGAAHVGSRECAEYLIAHGARIDIFAAAMLGQLQVVQAILTAFPQQRTAPGPHGIPLIVHAKAGGDQAQAVLAYLQA